MTLPDYLFIVAFVVLQPVLGLVGYRKLLRRMRSGLPVDRFKLYRNTIGTQWLMFVIGGLLWWWSDRNWASIGVVFFKDASFYTGLALTVCAILALWLQLAAIRRADQKSIERYFLQLGTMKPLIPTSRSELAVFNGMAVTAGIVEEFLWRGVLVWYLSQFLPLWAAATIGTFLFGLGHAYQGLQKIPQITLVGALFMLLYLLTGSLLLPIVLHIAVDLLQGRLAYEIVLRGSGPATEDAVIDKAAS